MPVRGREIARTVRGAGGGGVRSGEGRIESPLRHRWAGVFSLSGLSQELGARRAESVGFRDHLVGPKVEVFVDVQDGQAGELSCRGHDEVGYGRRPVLPAFCEQLQDGQRSILDGGCQVLDGHRGQGRSCESEPEVVGGSGGVAHLEQCQRGDPDQASSDVARPAIGVRASPETYERRLVDEPTC